MSASANSNSKSTLHAWAAQQSLGTAHFHASSLHALRDARPKSEVPPPMEPVEHDRSIFSPAAYFVDLLRLVDEKVKWSDGTNVPDELKLDTRRPDLKGIPLNPENTSDEVPYLDIVNEVLAAHLEASEASQALAEVDYHAQLDRIRTYLGHFKIAGARLELADIFETLGKSEEEIARATLNLSVTEFAKLTAKPEYKELSHLITGRSPALRWSAIELKTAIETVDKPEAAGRTIVVKLAKLARLQARSKRLSLLELVSLWGTQNFADKSDEASRRRLRLLASLLDLSSSETLLLLHTFKGVDREKLPEADAGAPPKAPALTIGSLDELILVVDWAAWLKRARLGVDQSPDQIKKIAAGFPEGTTALANSIISKPVAEVIEKMTGFFRLPPATVEMWITAKKLSVDALTHDTAIELLNPIARLAHILSKLDSGQKEGTGQEWSGQGEGALEIGDLLGGEGDAAAPLAKIRRESRLDRIIDLVRVFGGDAELLGKFNKLPNQNEEDSYKSVADALEKKARALYRSPAARDGALSELEDGSLSERKRDALASLLQEKLRKVTLSQLEISERKKRVDIELGLQTNMHEPNWMELVNESTDIDKKLKNPPLLSDYFGGFTSLKNVSDYLLIDVEMSGFEKISRIKAGLNTLQLYIQRCRCGLEGRKGAEGHGSLVFSFAGSGDDDIEHKKLEDQEWAWRSHYRLWEANRKVFLFPENYIEPSLRKQATPEFKELQDELLQGDLTPESVNRAYINYFDKIDVLANLKVVDLCRAQVCHSPALGDQETLFLIGKTENDPPVYYYRCAVLGSYGTQIDTWHPWRKIELGIHADHVACIYTNRRLYVAWAEQKTKTERDDKGGKTTSVIVTVNYSYHNAGGHWVPPQSLSDFSEIDLTNKEASFPPGATGSKLKLSKAVVTDKPKAVVSIENPNSISLDRPDHLDLFDPTPIWYSGTEPAEPAFRALALAVGTDGKTFFGGGIGGVWRSDDYGRTWISISDDLPREARILGIAVGYKSIFAMTEGNLYSSKLGSNKWTDVSPFDRGLKPIALSSPDGNRLYLSFSSERGSAFSACVDMAGNQELIGIKFSLENFHDCFLSDVISVTGGLCVGGAQECLRLNDGEAGWVLGTQTGLTLPKITRCPSSNVLYAVSVESPADVLHGNVIYKLRRSQNFGDTWEYAGADLPGVDMDGGQVIKGLSVTVDGFVIVLVEAGIYYSCDDCTTWAFVSFVEKVGKLITMAASGDGHLLLVGEIGRACARLRSPPAAAIARLREKLTSGGPGAMLAVTSQYTKDSPPGFSGGKLDFSLSSAFGQYYREVFFHIPFLIADALHGHQQFEEAQRWYNTVFDPMAKKEAGQPTESQPYWRYLPFRGHNGQSLKQTLNDPAEQAAYENDPFDPHAIAGLRPGTYEKAIVMKYIKNLLDWGDRLFARDNWEDIVRASMHYRMAQDLLGDGDRPAPTALPYQPDKTESYETLTKAEPPDFGVAIHIADVAYFPIGANTDFEDCRDAAADRLFKIRHGMNLQGALRQLALFEPPIDPRQLIRALAAGADLGDLTAGETQVPHYRFTTLIQHAKNVASSLIQLGAALLSALEKKDAEQLSLLRSSQERAILNLTTTIREKQLEEADNNVAALTESLGAAKTRQTYYDRLLAAGLSAEETVAIDAMVVGLVFQSETVELHAASVAGHLIPNIYGLADGGCQYGQAIDAGAQVAGSLSGVASQMSQLAATKAQNRRRAEEWELQSEVTQHEVDQIQAQLDGATLSRAIAALSVDLHQKSIEQAAAQEDFLRGKFSNQELYQWMVGRISEVHSATYRLAVELAKAAERAYRFELNTNDALITGGYWDNSKNGLMAGEGLMLALESLEGNYLRNDARAFEIEKTISLRMLFVPVGATTDVGAADARWKQFIEGEGKGTCTFTLSKDLFDADFPGHCCRKIKSIAITIPAIVGPYQNIQATLRQKFNTLTLPGGATRDDWRGQQQIALSRGINDSGLFELNFRDERYLPFEGTGAVSDWEFTLMGPNKDKILATVSDVIIHLRYTAMPAP